MVITNRALIVTGAILVGVGILFLAFNFIPGWSIDMAWPVIFFILAAGFYLPVMMFPQQRQWLAALCIPGSILLMLGLIFLYDTTTRDWQSWAFAWILILTAVGFGLAQASQLGGWGRESMMTGVWISLISLAVFSIFGAIFGGTVLRALSPVLLVLAGMVLLVRAVRK